MKATNWKTFGLAAFAIASLIFVSALVASSQGPQGRGGFPGGPGERGLGPLARGLNLTDDQKAQIQKITESFEASTKELHDSLRALHENEADPFTTAFDEAAVRAAATERAKIEVELDVARAKMLSQIGTILTTEQKAQLAARGPRFRQGPPPPPPGE